MLFSICYAFPVYIHLEVDFCKHSIPICGSPASKQECSKLYTIMKTCSALGSYKTIISLLVYRKMFRDPPYIQKFIAILSIMVELLGMMLPQGSLHSFFICMICGLIQLEHFYRVHVSTPTVCSSLPPSQGLGPWLSEGHEHFCVNLKMCCKSSLPRISLLSFGGR